MYRILNLKHIEIFIHRFIDFRIKYNGKLTTLGFITIMIFIGKVK
jgi:hypothetical protein